MFECEYLRFFPAEEIFQFKTKSGTRKGIEYRFRILTYFSNSINQLRSQLIMYGFLFPFYREAVRKELAYRVHFKKLGIFSCHRTERPPLRHCRMTSSLFDGFLAPYFSSNSESDSIKAFRTSLSGTLAHQVASIAP